MNGASTEVLPPVDDAAGLGEVEDVVGLEEPKSAMAAAIPASSQREPAVPLAPSLAKRYGLARLNTPLSPKP